MLRALLERYLPRTLFERPKRGFGVPTGAWRRGQLRDWAETLLDEHRIAKQGYLQPTAVRTLWQQHLSGRRDCPELLWHVLMFQAWHEHWQAARIEPGPAPHAAPSETSMEAAEGSTLAQREFKRLYKATGVRQVTCPLTLFSRRAREKSRRFVCDTCSPGFSPWNP